MTKGPPDPPRSTMGAADDAAQRLLAGTAIG
jgi:hypothetical protein